MNIKGYKLLKQVLKILHDVDKHNYENECRIYYTVEYKDNNIILSQVNTSKWYDDSYELYENCWDYTIEKIECTIEEYIQLLNKYIEIVSHPCSDQILDYEYYHISNDIKFI